LTQGVALAPAFALLRRGKRFALGYILSDRQPCLCVFASLRLCVKVGAHG